MRKRLLQVVLVLLLTALASSSAYAQEVTRSVSQASLDLSRSLSLDDVSPEVSSWRERLVTAVGGAALGAGMAYFASQLNTSDWEEMPGSYSNRGAWAAVGGGIGFGVGFSFPLSGRRPAAAPAQKPRSARSNRSIVTASEMAATVGFSVHDVLQVLRPEWLVQRPANLLGGAPMVSLPVYLDNTHLGDVEMLRRMDPDGVESISFVSAAVATARWGPGNPNGALLVIAKSWDGHAP